MNPEFPQTPREELETRLTALLLGELPADEAAALRRTLESDAELARLHDRLKETLGLVREAVASPGEPAGAQAAQLKLSEERREKLLAHFKTVKTKEFAPEKRAARFTLVELAAVLMIAVMLAAFLLPALSKAKSRGQHFSSDASDALGFFKREENDSAGVVTVSPAPEAGQVADAVSQRTRAVLAEQQSSQAVTTNSVHSLNVVGYVNVAKPTAQVKGVGSVVDAATKNVWSGGDAVGNTSGRIVGYVNKPLTAGGPTALANPLQPSDQPQPEKGQAPTASLERQSREVLGYQAGTTVVPASPPPAQRQQIVLPATEDFESRGVSKGTEVAAAQDHYFENLGRSTRGRAAGESRQSEISKSVGDQTWFDSAGKSAGALRYAVPRVEGEQLGQRIQIPDQPRAATTVEGMTETPNEWKFYTGVVANDPGLMANAPQKQGRAGLTDGSVAGFSPGRLQAVLKNSGEVVTGVSPVTGLPAANQPPSAPAPPAAQPVADLADSTITHSSGVELAPLPVQFPAPTLKGTPEDLPSGPNIEPLGEKPAGTRILGFPDGPAQARASEPAAPEQRAFAARYGLERSRASGGAGGGGGGGGRVAAPVTVGASQPVAEQTVQGIVADGIVPSPKWVGVLQQDVNATTPDSLPARTEAPPPPPPSPTVADAFAVEGDKVPVLGDLPTAGKLFRSESPVPETQKPDIALQGLTTIQGQPTVLFRHKLDAVSSGISPLGVEAPRDEFGKDVVTAARANALVDRSTDGLLGLNEPKHGEPASVVERYDTEAGGISRGGRIASESKVRSIDVKDSAASERARGMMRGGAVIVLPQVAQAGTELVAGERSKADEILRVPLRTEGSLERISPGQAGEAEGAAQIREAEREVDRLRRSLEISDLDATSSTAPPAPDAEPVRQLRNELITRQTALAKDQTQLEAMAKLGAKDERVKGDLAGLSDRVAAGQAAVDLLDKELDQVQQADAANARRSRPYFEAKQRLEEMQRSRKILDNKLSSEKIDFALPRSSLVEIVDPARPATAPQKSIWGKITGRPAEFASTARIKIERDGTDVQGMTAEPNAAGAYDPYFIQTEFEVIQSDAVLGKVVDRLKLDGAWADKGGGVKQQKEQAIKQLRQELSLKPVQNTGLVEIRAKSENAEEAAKLANTVAEVYREHRLEKGRQLAQGGIKALKEQFDEQEKKVAQAKAEVERLAEDAKIDVGVAPRKSTTNAPIPQPEIQTGDNAFSTFSLNVSDVSFKLAAASLEKGQMPDAASVRSEEFINAFDYRDPEPPAGVPVAFAWERARYPFAHNRDLLRFSLKTGAVGRQAGRPLNVVLLLDNSGSMERADRVRIIREALRVLAAQLQPQDKLSVITFARTPRLWVDGVAGDKAGEVAEQVSGITPQGGTNLEEAMNLAYATALRHYLANGMNRVVVLTDGAANLGNVQPEALKQKVEAHRKQGVALDCFGIGWEGFNDDLLEVLSRNGDGRYGFINSPEEAATEFAGQLAGALQVAASDVKVQVEFNPARVTAYRQIGYAKHQLTKEQFRDNTVDAAEIAAQEAGNALYTVEVNPAGEGPLCIVRVRFKIPGTSDYREHEWAVPFSGNAVFLEEASPAMRLAASASAFSEWLVASPFAGEVTPDHLLGYLSGVPEVYGADSRPKKLEWMIRQAKSIEGK